MQVEKLESFLELKAQSNQSDKASSESLLNSWLIFAIIHVYRVYIISVFNYIQLFKMVALCFTCKVAQCCTAIVIVKSQPMKTEIYRICRVALCKSMQIGEAKSLLWRCAAEGRGVHPFGALSAAEAQQNMAISVAISTMSSSLHCCVILQTEVNVGINQIGDHFLCV